MPIRNCAFKRIDSFRPPQPILPVKIINPENNKSIREKYQLEDLRVSIS